MDEDVKQFLEYVEESTEERAALSGAFVKEIHEKVLKVKNTREMEVELMTLADLKHEEREEGRKEGETKSLLSLVRKKRSKGNDAVSIADMLEQDEKYVNEIISLIEANPDLEDTQIAELIIQQKK